MGKNFKLLVLCADGVATSTIALVALREAFEDKGMIADFTQGRVVDAEHMLKGGNFDIVISTAGTDLDVETNVPIFSGIPFLTGIGRDEVIDQIKEIVNKK